MTVIQFSLYPVLAVLVAAWVQLLTTGSFTGTTSFLIGSVGIVGAAWKFGLKWAVSSVTKLLERRGVSGVNVDVLLAEPTVGTAYWNHKEVAPLLAPAVQDS